MLSGDIPTTVGGLESLLVLDLANNRLEGSIPDSLGRILSLEELDESHNDLTGEVPKSLEALLYLTYLNASFNDLSGEIPNGGPFVNFTRQSFMSNKALCGASRFQVPPCLLRSRKKSRRKRKLLITMCTTLGIASMVLLLLVTFALLKRRRKRQGSGTIQTFDVATHQRMSYHELEEATDGFNESDALGKGGFSSVYKGRLTDGSFVAVKVFDMELEGAFKSFYTECELLCSLRHRNLTKVVSSCSNVDFRALILEYMAEYGVEGIVSTRSDTYSFRIVLMETFTRRKPSDEMFGGELSLKQWVKNSIPSEVTTVIDSNLLTREECSNVDAKVECCLSVMEVALKCSEEWPEMRMSMKNAVMALNKIKLKFLASCGKESTEIGKHH
ncbi:hypothetical protein ACS0TY_018936 [Phlomoides rotata]